MKVSEIEFWFMNLFFFIKKPDLFLTVMTSGRPKKVHSCPYFVGEDLGERFALLNPLVNINVPN